MSFFSCSLHNSFHAYHTAWLKCLCRAHSYHLHAIHDERLIVRSLSVSSCLSFSCFSPLFTSSLCTPSSMWTTPRETPAAPSPNEEYCTQATYHPPTSYDPNVLDDFHYSETSDLIFPGGIRRHRYGGLRTRLMPNSTMRSSEKRAIFTTVHSRARRTSGPKTSLSLS